MGGRASFTFLKVFPLKMCLYLLVSWRNVSQAIGWPDA